VLPGEAALDAPTRHLLGTDGSGRDVASRLLWGGRVSLTVGFLSALCLTLLGTAIGAVAGWAGGLTDLVVSRAIEVVAAFPAFFLVLAAMAFLDRDVVSPVLGLVAVIALVNWTAVARLVRAELLRLSGADFVLALESLGFSRGRILVRHVLPQALAPVWVAFAFAAAGGVLVESTISFLGFGVARPTASWGALIAESASPERWWLSVFPGLAILATVSSTHLVAQGLARALDPRAGPLVPGASGAAHERAASAGGSA
jgi:peptide/nickel transport system permease protein